MVQLAGPPLVAQSRERRQSLVVRVLLFAVTAYILNGFLIWRGTFPYALALAIQMWIPGVVALVCRVVFREGFADVGWHAGARRYWLWAIVGPFAFASFTHLCAGLIGQVSLASNLSAQFLLQSPLLSLRWPARAYGFPAVQLLLRLAAVVAVGLPVAYLYALGEELGGAAICRPGSCKLVSTGRCWLAASSGPPGICRYRSSSGSVITGHWLLSRCTSST